MAKKKLEARSALGSIAQALIQDKLAPDHRVTDDKQRLGVPGSQPPPQTSSHACAPVGRPLGLTRRDLGVSVQSTRLRLLFGKARERSKTRTLLRKQRTILRSMALVCRCFLEHLGKTAVLVSS